jgi:hypothetical protein
MKKIIAIVVSAVTMFLVTQPALTCQVDEFYNTKEGALAASTPETLNTAIQLQEQGNKDKLASLMTSGTVLLLPENVKVQVLERSFEFKLLRIKLPNERYSYWVREGSLKQINCN